MTYLADRHAQAIATITAWLNEAYPQSATATPGDLSAHGLNDRYEGWRIPLRPGVSLILAVDRSFPFSLPKTAVAGVPIDLAPHVEEDLRLCTWGDGAAFDTGNPAVVAQAYVDASTALIAEIESGGDISDYSVDFEAYWRRSAVTRFDLLSIVPVTPPSRSIVGWYGERLIFLGETAADCDRWLNHRFGTGKARPRRPGALIWMDPLPKPDEYPFDGGSLRRLVETRTPDALAILDQLLTSSDGRQALLLAGPATPKRSAVGGLILDHGVRQGRFGRGRSPDQGFRKGNVPPAIVAGRSRLRRTEVQQVNSSLTRLELGVFQTLRARKVAVLGCGALGSGVARLLAQTGVGQLLLVDPDTLGWENLGRHELGAAYVGQNKARGLASDLLNRLPHLIACDGEPHDWMQVAQMNEAAFDDCDLIISAIGSWVSESGLDDFARSRTDHPVVYCWLERRAMAAHAVALAKGGPCFRCGFTAEGEPLLRATTWLHEEDNEQCAAVTSPYGATELSFAQALASGLALELLLNRAAAPAHRVWLGRTSELERQGGSWSQQWHDGVGDPGAGGVTLGAVWPQREGCICA